MKSILAFLLLFGATCIHAQTAKIPFADDIALFAKQDSAQPLPRKPIVFVGSSSFTRWTTVQQDMNNKRILNRGFGGSTIPDVGRYAQQTIYKYKPSKIVFYCGENDLASSDTIKAETVTARFIDLFRDVRKNLGNVPFVFISIKPSPSREHLKAKIVAANEQINQFLSSEEAAEYVDVYNNMVDDLGRPRGELFTSDSLHMNSKGYEIWKEKLKKAVR